jgi:hypothetical protein
MHPIRANDPLQVPMCADVIIALQQCHRVHSIAKFWGHCNEARANLDKCLVEEKIIRRTENLQSGNYLREKEENLAYIKARRAERLAQQQQQQQQ